jgi:hypothetical protein
MPLVVRGLLGPLLVTRGLASGAGAAAADMYAALYRHFLASALPAAFAADDPDQQRYFLGRADDDAKLPYVVASVIARIPEYTTRKDARERIDLRFSVYAAKMDDAAVLGDAFIRAYDFARLPAFADGKLMQFRRTGGALIRVKERGPDGEEYRRCDLTYRALVGRPAAGG